MVQETAQPPFSQKEASASKRDAEDKKLLWLTFLRVAIVTVLFGSTIIVHFTGGPAPLPAYLYALIAVVYLLTLVYVYLLHQRVPHRTQATLQVGADVAVYSALVYLTGGAESAFTFIYSLAIINAAILLYRRGALWTAAACTAAFGTMVLLESMSVLAPFEHLSSALPPLSAVNTVFTNAAAFFFIALLSSFLAEQLRATETALAEAKGGLENLRALSENILRSIGDGLLTADLDGRVSYANEAAREILGRSDEALLGQPLQRLFTSLGDGASAWEEALAARYREVSVERPDGTPAVLGLSASALRDATQAPRGWLLVFHDLSVLKAMEQTVRRSERLAAVGKLAADMAHEIRNPLASMTGSIELMSHDVGLTPETQVLMGIVLREGERLNQLISDFLDYARPTDPEAAPFDLAQVIEETMWMFRHQKFGEVEPEIESVVRGPIPLEADLNQVKQVLWNLLKNAVESLPGKGRVVLRAAPGEHGGARLEIEDDGAGIKAAELPHLFEPFFTTKPMGTGLGLATVHRILEAHGGHIEVQSEPGRATCFTVLLPPRPPVSATPSRFDTGARRVVPGEAA